MYPRDVENAKIGDIPDGIPPIPSYSIFRQTTSLKAGEIIPWSSNTFHCVPRSSKEFQAFPPKFQNYSMTFHRVPWSSKME